MLGGEVLPVPWRMEEAGVHSKIGKFISTTNWKQEAWVMVTAP